ncbi:MAG: signal peptidase II [Caulobacterales bacterium]
MRPVSRLGLTAHALAAGVIVLDQAVKYWVLAVFRLPERQSAPVWGPLRLTMVQNRGISFGFLQAQADWARWLLVVFSVGVAVGLAWWVRRADRPIPALAVGFIIGGAVGNAIDRIRLGWVADFLDFSQLHFPWVFNVADSAINVGVALILLDAVLAPPKRAPA